MNNSGIPLSNAIEALYKALRMPMPRAIEGCPDPKQLCRLLNKRLRDLTPEELSDYGSSVFWTMGSESDFRYFLPRMLEILVSQPDWWPSIEVVMKKLALAHWETWTDQERGSINCLLDSWFKARLDMGADAAEELDSLLCGIALSGAPIAQYLDRLMDKPSALVAVYELNSNALLKNKKLANAFWSGEREASRPIVAFFQSPRVRSLLDSKPTG